MTELLSTFKSLLKFEWGSEDETILTTLEHVTCLNQLLYPDFNSKEFYINIDDFLNTPACYYCSEVNDFITATERIFDSKELMNSEKFIDVYRKEIIPLIEDVIQKILKK